MRQLVWTFLALAIFAPIYINAQLVGGRKEIRSHYLPETTHLGYYDLSEFAYSPSGGYVETKNWNGSSYIRSKCQEFDIINNKSTHYRPCSF